MAFRVGIFQWKALSCVQVFFLCDLMSNKKEVL